LHLPKKIADPTLHLPRKSEPSKVRTLLTFHASERAMPSGISPAGSQGLPPMNNPLPQTIEVTPEQIAACATRWCHSPEIIIRERQRDYLRQMLTCAEMDYDDAAFHYACRDLISDAEPNTGDLFVRIAYEISSDETLTTAEVGRLAKMLANMAIAVVLTNIAESDADDERLEAVVASWQAVEPI
jgi:hypothetical protein